MGLHKFSLLMTVQNYVYFLCLNINRVLIHLHRDAVWVMRYVHSDLILVFLQCLNISIDTTFRICPASTQ